MKANEAPEKLYVDAKDNSDDFFLYGFMRKSGDEDIEYTRTDAFIEKAVDWLSNMPIEDMEYKYDDFDTSEGWYRMIEDFKNYMKGE